MGEKVVLVRLETSPEDIEGMKSCTGYSDRSRRYDQPCSSSSTWYGYLLCIRMRLISQWMKQIRSLHWQAKSTMKETGISIDGSTG